MQDSKLATMATSPVVLITAAELVPGLKTEAGFGRDILTFADTDVAHAVQAIMAYQPNLVVLQRDFLATARGVALVGRIRTDPILSHVQIRVLFDVSDYVKLVSRLARPGLDAATAVPGDPLPLEYDSWARRFQMRADVEVRLNGNPATLADLSQTGAQLLVPTPLRLNQRVRLLLGDDQGVCRVAASVVWAVFEAPRDAPHRYRVGVKFIDGDPGAIEAFCAQHRTPESAKLRINSEKRSPDEGEIVGNDLAHGAARGANAPFQRTEDQETALDEPSGPLAEAHVAAQTPQVVSGEPGKVDTSQTEARQRKSRDRTTRARKLRSGAPAGIKNRKP